MDEVEVEIDPKDIELTTARSGGAGGNLIEIVWNIFLSPFDFIFWKSQLRRSLIFVTRRRAKCEQGWDSNRPFSQTNRNPNILYGRKDSTPKQESRPSVATSEIVRPNNIWCSLWFLSKLFGHIFFGLDLWRPVKLLQVWDKIKGT